MKGRIATIVMAVLLVVYLVLVGQRAVLLMISGQLAGVIMGIALIILPLIAVWAIWREIMFGVHTEKLVHILEAEGGLPIDDLPHRTSGRPVRDAADAEFPRYRTEVEQQPQSWRAWFRLGLAYDASGDRKRARQALREAIRLYRDSSHSIA
ncbi:MAG TPA: tetratricopeptide repeat protein [Microbacteriaceae bacterium]|jgi:tetratricopeptide (TPR) repeat protein|nr:tetratricopeptide repeat protein [Microbacteriaceae bacterium]